MSALSDLYGTQGSAQPSPAQGGSDPRRQAIQSLLLSDLSKNGGKNVAAITTLGKAFGTDVTADPTQLNATQQKAANQKTAAQNAFNTIIGDYSKIGPKGRIRGTFDNLLGRAGINSSADTYNQEQGAYITNIARALGETGVITDADISRYQGLIPKITDTPSTAQAKIANLKATLGIQDQGGQVSGQSQGRPSLGSFLTK